MKLWQVICMEKKKGNPQWIGEQFIEDLKEYLHTESNRNRRNRNPIFYPLNYGDLLKADKASEDRRSLTLQASSTGGISPIRSGREPGKATGSRMVHTGRHSVSARDFANWPCVCKVRVFLRNLQTSSYGSKVAWWINSYENSNVLQWVEDCSNDQ